MNGKIDEPTHPTPASPRREGDLPMDIPVAPDPIYGPFHELKMTPEQEYGWDVADYIEGFNHGLMTAYAKLKSKL